ncbi:MAG: [acyl-carrier-protein] S-malonyltransferase [Paraglaciecola sp.]|jgi:[acyl-carrier-protein] S-malonyltransferase
MLNTATQQHSKPQYTKQRAVVICPGRGTYNKDELGYLQHLHADKPEILTIIDTHRLARGQTPVAELDAMAKYNMRVHTAGENASALIYACAQGDYQDIDLEQYDIVAVTGNSMGWYIALAVAGALNASHATELINTMGSMMSEGIIGGQLIYPVVDADWQENSTLKSQIHRWIDEVNQLAGAQLYPSIYLGGYVVLGGNEKGLQEIEKRLENIDDKYPMRLFNHAAFHTPLLEEVSLKARQDLPSSSFAPPKLPLIDGEGTIWQPHSADLEALYQYTLGRQVTQPYNFSKAIEVALKEFAPDKLIILGPGATLGGAVGQCLVAQQWFDMNSKEDFINTQKHEPRVLAMGIPEQREQVAAK